MPLRPFQVAGHHYTTRSKPAAQLPLVNLYPEPAQDSSRCPGGFYLKPTPGSKPWATVGKGPIRGLTFFDGKLIAVSGTAVYSVTSGGVPALLGHVGGSLTAPVYMQANTTQLMIIDGSGGWYVQDGVMNAITDEDFEGASSLAFINGFMVVTLPDKQQFRWSRPYDVTDWNGLDFASAEGSPDDALAVVQQRQLLWFAGGKSVEAFYTGEGFVTAPFIRYDGSFIDRGCAAAASAIAVDQQVIWLADDRTVRMIENNSPRPISTPALEEKFEDYETISDAWATTYSWDGEHVYALTFPTEGVTWELGLRTGRWRERSSGIGLDRTRWRYNVVFRAFGKVLAGDSLSGRIDELTTDPTESGEAIERQWSMIEIHNNRARFNCPRVELDIESGQGTATGQGADPRIMHDISRDGGHTYMAERLMQPGKTGEYTARPYSTRLGQGRNLINRFRMTDPVGIAVYGGYAEVQPLGN